MGIKLDDLRVGDWIRVTPWVTKTGIFKLDLNKFYRIRATPSRMYEIRDDDNYRLYVAWDWIADVRVGDHLPDEYNFNENSVPAPIRPTDLVENLRSIYSMDFLKAV